MKPLLALVSALLVAIPFQQDGQEQKKPATAVVGKAAPSFRLNDHTGRAVEIGGESEGWTVLAFFPKAATPG